MGHRKRLHTADGPARGDQLLCETSGFSGVIGHLYGVVNPRRSLHSDQRRTPGSARGSSPPSRVWPAAHVHTHSVHTQVSLHKSRHAALRLHYLYPQSHFGPSDPPRALTLLVAGSRSSPRIRGCIKPPPLVIMKVSYIRIRGKNSGWGGGINCQSRNSDRVIGGWGAFS